VTRRANAVYQTTLALTTVQGELQPTLTGVYPKRERCQRWRFPRWLKGDSTYRMTAFLVNFGSAKQNIQNTC